MKKKNKVRLFSERTLYILNNIMHQFSGVTKKSIYKKTILRINYSRLNFDQLNTATTIFIINIIFGRTVGYLIVKSCKITGL